MDHAKVKLFLQGELLQFPTRLEVIMWAIALIMSGNTRSSGPVI